MDGRLMSVLIVGSTALYSIKRPGRKTPGYSAARPVYAAVVPASSGRSNWWGWWGEDFPKHIQLYQRHRIDLEGLQRLPGKTFIGPVKYEANMNNRRTLLTELGVFETFIRRCPKPTRRPRSYYWPIIAPGLQSHVLSQMARPRFVAADTMICG